MGYYRPHPSNEDLMSVGDAYHVVWGAGSIALRETSVGPEVKAIQGEELTQIFSRLDAVRHDAEILQGVLPETDKLQVSLGTIVEPLTDEINRIYADHGAESDANFNPFCVNDDRMTALMGLDIYIRVSKNSLFDARNST